MNSKKISLITFNPVGGLNRYKPKDTGEEDFYKKLLWKRLLSLFSITKIGGLIFIGLDFTFQSASFVKDVFNNNPERFLRHGFIPLQIEGSGSLLLKRIR